MSNAGRFAYGTASLVGSKSPTFPIKNRSVPRSFRYASEVCFNTPGPMSTSEA